MLLLSLSEPMLPFSSSLLMVATHASSYSSIALCSLPKLVTTQRDMMPPLLVLTGIMAKQTKTNYFKMTKWHLYTIERQSAWCGFKDTVRWPLPEVAKHKFFCTFWPFGLHGLLTWCALTGVDLAACLLIKLWQAQYDDCIPYNCNFQNMIRYV
jgi:hypothetical protein